MIRRILRRLIKPAAQPAVPPPALSVPPRPIDAWLEARAKPWHGDLPPETLIYPEGSTVPWTLREIRMLRDDPTWMPTDLERIG